MSDIFSATPTFGGAFAMDEAMLTFGVRGGDGGLGFLIQSVSVQYDRPVQRIYELGPRKTTYYVTGRSEGRMQISRLAAPAPVSSSFMKQYANVCNVQDNNMIINATPSAQCTGTIGGQPITASKYKFSYCLIESFALQMAVQAIALTESISMVFAAMESSQNN